MKATNPDASKPETTKSAAPVVTPSRTPLKDELEARKAEFTKATPPEKSALYEQGIREVKESGVVERAMKKGATAPDFELPDARGNRVSLKSLLAQGPVVLTFYRGGWCPYCNIQLHAYQDALPEIKAAGAQLVAISPETPDNSLSTAEKNALEFVVLSDAGNAVARKFGVAFKLPPSIAPGFAPLLAKFNGPDADDELPVSATYVIAPSGEITYAYLNADYRERAEPADVIAALKSLKR